MEATTATTNTNKSSQTVLAARCKTDDDDELQVFALLITTITGKEITFILSHHKREHQKLQRDIAHVWPHNSNWSHSEENREREKERRRENLD